MSFRWLIAFGCTAVRARRIRLFRKAIARPNRRGEMQRARPSVCWIALPTFWFGGSTDQAPGGPSVWVTRRERASRTASALHASAGAVHGFIVSLPAVRIFAPMLRVIGRVAGEHDVWLVLLAGILCMISANTAIALLSRAHEGSRAGRARWLLGAAVVTGCGIWATHFVAMLAFQPPMPVGYSGAETMLSYFAAVLITGLGYWVAVEWHPLPGGLITGVGHCRRTFLRHPWAACPSG